MALGDLDESDVSDNSGSSGDGSGSSSRYPRFRKITPWMALVRDDDGSLRPRRQPDDLPIVKRKDDEHSSYEIDSIPDCFEKYWMSDSEFKLHQHMVRTELGADLYEMIQDNPAGVREAIRKAAQTYKTDRSISRVRNCAVCGDDIDVAEQEYEMVDDRHVHPHHTAEELMDSGILD